MKNFVAHFNVHPEASTMAGALDNQLDKITWPVISAVIVPPQNEHNEHMNRMAKVAEVEDIFGSNSMDFHSARTIWLLVPLNVSNGVTLDVALFL